MMSLIGQLRLKSREMRQKWTHIDCWCLSMVALLPPPTAALSPSLLFSSINAVISAFAGGIPHQDCPIVVPVGAQVSPMLQIRSLLAITIAASFTISLSLQQFGVPSLTDCVINRQERTTTPRLHWVRQWDSTCRRRWPLQVVNPVKRGNEWITWFVFFFVATAFRW